MDDEAPRVLALANSRLARPAETVEDLPDAAAAGRWLADRFGGDVPALDDAAFAALLRLRAAVRGLMLDRISGRRPDERLLAAVNDTAALALRTDRLTGDWSHEIAYRTRSARDDSSATRLATLAREAIELLSSDGDLAECAAADCVMIFLRTDPRRRWHDDRCGNRIRAARSHARRKQAVSARHPDPADEHAAG